MTDQLRLCDDVGTGGYEDAGNDDPAADCGG